MKIINEVQGSSGWLDVRRKYDTASEASSLMGFGYSSRGDLLRMKATGSEQEFSKWTLEVLFAKGHEVEALARPLAEELIGEELFPVTGVCLETGLLASFDGLTMDESVVWECKQWNEAKASQVRAGMVPESDYWQVVQQLIVSGASYCLYMVTDGTPYNTVSIKLLAAEYGADKTGLTPLDASGTPWTVIRAGDPARLVASWDQFNSELADFVPVVVAPEAVGVSPDQLPALLVEVTGMVTASNLEGFRDHALAVFGSITTDLETDKDFADAEKTVKWCKEVEVRLDRAKDQALSQTASIDELFRAIDSIKAEARSKRLELDRAVKSRKDNIRAEIISAANNALVEHLADLHAAFTGFPGAFKLPPATADFAGALKGKRTVTSLRDSADAELARVKIETSQQAMAVMANIGVLALHAEGFESLFRDASALVLGISPENLEAVVKGRISEAKAEAAAVVAAAIPAPVASVVPTPIASAPVAAPVADDSLPPTPEVIVDVVAGYFDVSGDVALGWILDISKQEVA